MRGWERQVRGWERQVRGWERDLEADRGEGLETDRVEAERETVERLRER